MAVKNTIDFNERFDKIDTQFDGVKKQFDKIDAQFDGVNKQLDRIVTVVVKGFDRIDTELGRKADKKDINQLYSLMDKMAKRQEIDEDERLVMRNQLKRLDRWVHEVADKIGYKLST